MPMKYYLEDDMTFVVVKSDAPLDGTVLFGDISGLTQVQNEGIIGEYYKLSIPTEPTNAVFAFTADKQANTFTMLYKDAAGETVDTVTLDGTYYLLGSLESDGIEFFAEVPQNNDTTITFKRADGTDAPAEIPHVAFTL